MGLPFCNPVPGPTIIHWKQKQIHKYTATRLLRESTTGLTSCAEFAQGITEARSRVSALVCCSGIAQLRRSFLPQPCGNKHENVNAHIFTYTELID
uniref:Uncharacterized protein n=1 Tax=Physcomitrium patens TaxID=3218 RepID=A0A2K1L0Z9_PHYPA|nr:hypothetical protein PHYPA_002487 [Physcomitrium patens]